MDSSKSQNGCSKFLSSPVLAGIVAVFTLAWALYTFYENKQDTQQQLHYQATQIALLDPQQQLQYQATQIALLAEQNQLQILQSTSLPEQSKFEDQLLTPMPADNGNFSLTATALLDQASQIEATNEAVATRLAVIQVTQTALAAQADSIYPSLSAISKGRLIYECDFTKACEWNVETGMKIESGMLFVSPGYDAVLGSALSFTDFIVEARFLMPPSGSMAFYIRHQRPSCSDWNCSIQIGLYPQEVVARRFLGSKPGQQVDIKKNNSVTSLQSNGWNTIAIVLQRNNYTVYINGVLALEFTDNTYGSGSFIIDNAIGSTADVQIDYFYVYEIQ